jgi:hypothetical protein
MDERVIVDRFPEQKADFSLLQNVQTGSRAYNLLFDG